MNQWAACIETLKFFSDAADFQEIFVVNFNKLQKQTVKWTSTQFNCNWRGVTGTSNNLALCHPVKLHRIVLAFFFFLNLQKNYKIIDVKLTQTFCVVKFVRYKLYIYRKSHHPKHGK